MTGSRSFGAHGRRDSAGNGEVSNTQQNEEDDSMTSRLMPRPSPRRRQMALLLAMSLIFALAMQYLPPAPAIAQNVGGQLNYLGWEGYDDKAAFKPMTDQGVVFNTTYIGNNDELIAKFKADPKRTVTAPSQADLASLQPVYQKVTTEWVAKSPGNAELLSKARELLAGIRAK
jgi:hypothetical protein